jgi:inner membrane protein
VDKSGFRTTVAKRSNLLILPQLLDMQFRVENKVLHKGIYDVPVYNSAVSLTAQFDHEDIKRQLEKVQQAGNFVGFEQAFVAISISDVRGIEEKPELSINQKSFRLKPGSGMEYLPTGLHADVDKALLDADLALSFKTSLRGIAALNFLPLADAAEVTMQSDWLHPEFAGATLPAQRKIDSNGFEAYWTQTLYANDGATQLRHCLTTSECHNLLSTVSGVRFIEPVDVYLQTERAIKYAMLFVGLSFAAFFLFEQLRRIPIHPIQYGFVGVGLAVFYLLLISLAEHMAFVMAYVVAAVACIALLVSYTRHMLRDRFAAILFAVMLASLYGLLYVIVQSEDYALLMGSLLVFFVLAVLMLVTRRINWYQLGNASAQTEK